MLAFYTNVAVFAVMFAISAGALNMLIGECGIFSSAQAAFYGVGAYCAALTAMHLGGSLVLATVIGVVGSAAFSLLLSIPAIRVPGDYFVVASLAFGIIATTVFQQWYSVTGGDAGLYGIPLATVFGQEVATAGGYLGVSVALLVVTMVVLWVVIRKAPLGRMMRAVREDEIAVAAMGKSPAYIRLLAVVISAGLSGLSGVIYAFYVSFVDPTAFALNQMILFVMMVILGGSSNLLGPVIGALVTQFGIASLGLVQLPPRFLGPLQQVIIGVVLIVLMLVAPEGLTSIPRMLRRRRDLKQADDGSPSRVPAPAPPEYVEGVPG